MSPVECADGDDGIFVGRDRKWTFYFNLLSVVRFERAILSSPFSGQDIHVCLFKRRQIVPAPVHSQYWIGGKSDIDAVRLQHGANVGCAMTIKSERFVVAAVYSGDLVVSEVEAPVGDGSIMQGGGEPPSDERIRGVVHIFDDVAVAAGELAEVRSVGFTVCHTASLDMFHAEYAV